eukprot:jgi/Tetstr1/463607/TSEL_000760.t2
MPRAEDEEGCADARDEGGGCPELGGDELVYTLGILDWRSLAMCSSVCKAWRDASMAVLASPRQRMRLEFGHDFAAAMERSAAPDAPFHELMASCQRHCRWLAHEQHEARWEYASRQIVRAWQLSVRMHGHARRFSPVLHLPLPQSVWLRFSLPLTPTWGPGMAACDLACDAMDIELLAECGPTAGQRAVLEVQGWRVPANDTDLFLDSHRTGIYAWLAGEGEGEGPREPWEENTEELGEGGEKAGEDACVVHVAVYVHFEQAFEPAALGALSLPQTLSLGSRSMRALDPLQVSIDFCKMREGRVGGCRCRLIGPPSGLLPPSSGAPLGLPQGQRRFCLEPASLEVFRCDTSGGSLRRLAPGVQPGVGATRRAAEARPSAASAWADQLAMLSRFAEDEALVDFAVYDCEGALLLGRSGVEMWETQAGGGSDSDSEADMPGGGPGAGSRQEGVCWRMPFLVDGLDTGGGMWDNWLMLRPAVGCPAEAVLTLELSESALLALWLAAGRRGQQQPFLMA